MKEKNNSKSNKQTKFFLLAFHPNSTRKTKKISFSERAANRGARRRKELTNKIAGIRRFGGQAFRRAGGSFTANHFFGIPQNPCPGFPRKARMTLRRKNLFVLTWWGYKKRRLFSLISFGLLLHPHHPSPNTLLTFFFKEKLTNNNHVRRRGCSPCY